MSMLIPMTSIKACGGLKDRLRVCMRHLRRCTTTTMIITTFIGTSHVKTIDGVESVPALQPDHVQVLKGDA